MSFFDPNDVAPRDVYKLLTSIVVPRPIAWVTSVDENNVVNAAPFSYFNLVGSDPPIMALGLAPRSPGVGKDTALNIRQRGEFVVNLVSFALREEMNICAVDFPHGESEIDATQLQLAASNYVKVPRLADSPASLECREIQTIEIGRNRVVMGQIVGLWVQDEFVDTSNYHVDGPALDIIGRMGGGGGYCRTSDTFQIERLNYAEWRDLKASEYADS